MKFLLAILALAAALASAATTPTTSFAESNTTAFNIITNITAFYDITTDWQFSSNTTAHTIHTQPKCNLGGHGVCENVATQAILAFCTANDGTTIHGSTKEHSPYSLAPDTTDQGNLILLIDTLSCQMQVLDHHTCFYYFWMSINGCNTDSDSTQRARWFTPCMASWAYTDPDKRFFLATHS
ncbi:hypothetical protein LTR17_009276 [Elasticomyces elasticus]|nr:hypothetical protein LTR17_009276 [Elasticomyces elasticus]